MERYGYKDLQEEELTDEEHEEEKKKKKGQIFFDLDRLMTPPCVERRRR